MAGRPDETRPEPSHLEHRADCRAELDQWRSVARSGDGAFQGGRKVRPPAARRTSGGG
ncbi:hypothetical protein [Actinomadura rayongensis]|uniref:Uncharacterized protein n=1 Tax=Actinomadura rayongensis TaxID=1429076 RepID=A0A6I4WC07_9ACTN|nr:hypothetical protein [Actinomadura rayongensis]MXQ66633.1 hypothetical protein [Actinomadura rayongensis]